MRAWQHAMAMQGAKPQRSRLARARLSRALHGQPTARRTWNAGAPAAAPSWAASCSRMSVWHRQMLVQKSSAARPSAAAAASPPCARAPPASRGRRRCPRGLVRPGAARPQTLPPPPGAPRGKHAADATGCAPRAGLFWLGKHARCTWAKVPPALQHTAATTTQPHKGCQNQTWQ